LEKFNLLFAGIFAVEMLLRLLSMGFKIYFKGHWFNFFDAIIVISSFIDITISEVLINESTKIKNSGSVFTALRAFRLLRVFKLAKSWKRFQLLLETMAHTLKDVASFSILLMLFTFILTLLGMELFANKMKLDPITNYVDLENGVSPEVNFDNFINAFSAVFIILTNDGTSGIYYNLYRTVSSYTSTIYIIILILIGQKVILNLFIAILLQNFDEGALR
jgi:Ion transport protein